MKIAYLFLFLKGKIILARSALAEMLGSFSVKWGTFRIAELTDILLQVPDHFYKGPKILYN
jgi:hypothetical protein